MIIRKTTIEAVEAAANSVGVAVDITDLSASRGGGRTLSVKVNLPDGPPGSPDDRERYRRISHRGRRINAVCWHGFRDFFRTLFEYSPEAVVKTALATYDGPEGFEATYPSTGEGNIGSLWEPMAMADACLCVDSGDRH